MLTNDIRQNILKRFPKIELPYEKNLHNKVHTDLYLAMPYGDKVYIWFTYFKNKDLCVILTINKYNLIIDVSEINIDYSKEEKNIFRQLEALYECARRVSTGISHFIGAVG